MRWTDVDDIAIELEEQHPDINIKTISFTKLHELVVKLRGFSDDPKKSNELVLEAIQSAWLEERG